MVRTVYTTTVELAVRWSVAVQAAAYVLGHEVQHDNDVVKRRHLTDIVILRGLASALQVTIWQGNPH